MNFEWDPSKAETNRKKHGVSFAEATTVFCDPLSVTVQDPDHSRHEERFQIVGMSKTGKLLVVTHTDRGENIRIISARPATRKERQNYEKEK